jgi:hypothetical protein
MRSADLNSWICVGDKTYLQSVRLGLLARTGYLPAWRVRLEILALPLEHARPDLGGSRVVFSGVLDIFQSAQRHVWVDEVRVASHKLAPLKIARHGNRTTAQFLNRVVLLVGIALQDTSKSIVGFLNFADDNRLEFAARVLKVEVSLYVLAESGHCARDN